MVFDWQEYLRLAEELAKASKEAKLRSSISRAYYSAFCSARNYLRDIKHDQNPKYYPQNIHTYVRNRFKHSPDKTLRKVGELLNILRGYRNQADYNDSIDELSLKVTKSLRSARYIISTLSK